LFSFPSSGPYTAFFLPHMSAINGLYLHPFHLFAPISFICTHFVPVDLGVNMGVLGKKRVWLVCVFLLMFSGIITLTMRARYIATP